MATFCKDLPPTGLGETAHRRVLIMSDHAQEEHVARIAGDIMFGDKYMDLLESIYSERDTIVEFETNPKHFLKRHGINIPDAIEVVIHDPGALGRPARVDFHWEESEQTAR